MDTFHVVNVHAVHETDPAYNPPGTYIVWLDWYYEDINGQQSEMFLNEPYTLTSTNPDLGDVLRQWMLDHAEFPITPYTPPPEPTIEEIRAAMPPVTSRQLRLTLVRNGYSLSVIDAAIQGLPEGPAKDEAQIEWEYATQFERLAPTLLTIAAALSISAEDIDTMWQQALAA